MIPKYHSGRLLIVRLECCSIVVLGRCLRSGLFYDCPASAPLIGRHCQAPVLRLLVQVVAGVGHAPFRSRFNHRCTHGSDGMESLAYGRAFKRSRHLRLHPDLVHNRDIFLTDLPVSKSSFQQNRIGNRCRLTTSDAVSRPVYGPRRPSRADALSFSLI